MLTSGKCGICYPNYLVVVFNKKLFNELMINIESLFNGLFSNYSETHRSIIELQELEKKFR